MKSGLQSEVSDTLEGLTQVHHEMVGQWLDEAVLSVNEDLKPGVSESRQDRNEATIAVWGSGQPLSSLG